MFLTQNLTFCIDQYGGDVGLAITQAVGLMGMIQWGMRQSAELENNMTSLERILEYTTVESELSLESLPGGFSFSCHRTRNSV